MRLVCNSMVNRGNLRDPSEVGGPAGPDVGDPTLNRSSPSLVQCRSRSNGSAQAFSASERGGLGGRVCHPVATAPGPIHQDQVIRGGVDLVEQGTQVEVGQHAIAAAQQVDLDQAGVTVKHLALL